MGRRALAVPTDLMQDDQVEALAARTMDEFGRVDILINNAGYLHRDPISKMTMKRWDIVQGVNLRGAVMCTKAFLPHMIERRKGGVGASSTYRPDPRVHRPRCWRWTPMETAQPLQRGWVNPLEQ
jgi:NAD(P)-dependent dehydrogenase (short-subunit alcohol dehydrogenase family)